MFYQTFLSPQMKRCTIITDICINGIYELPHEFPNDLRLRKLGNIRKVFKLHKMIAQCLFPQAPSNLIYLTILLTLRRLMQIWNEIRAIKLQKSAKICLTWELLFWFFNWGWSLVLKDFQVCFRKFYRKIK